MSLNDRPSSSYMSAPRSRVVSSHSGETHRGTRRDKYPSPQPEKMDHLRTSTSSPKGPSREHNNAFDRRTEHTITITREKSHIKTRHPVKESVNAANRGDKEKIRTRRPSQPEGVVPIVRKKDREKDQAEGRYLLACKV